MSLVAHVLAAVQDVRVVNTGGDGITARDVLVPVSALAAALVGGLGGVVLGGRMNRSTLRTLEDERAEREDAREEARAARELRLENLRSERDRAIHRRRALAALRRLHAEFRRMRQVADGEGSGGGSLSEEWESQRFLVPSEAINDVAAWVSDGCWERITRALDSIEVVSRNREDLRRRLAAADDSAEEWDHYRALLRHFDGLLSRTMDAIREELTRMGQETADGPTD